MISILNSQNNQNQRRKYLLCDYHIFKWFSIVQIICIIPSTINRIFNVIDNEPIFIISLLQTIFGSLIGLGYFIIYIQMLNICFTNFYTDNSCVLYVLQLFNL